MGLDPEKDVIYFARTDFRGSNRLFGIKRSDRRQHVYIIGKTGTGKSALEYNMIIQDIANGEGVCVVDPHGELIENLLDKIPKERLDDVIYFNPADTDYHIGFNVLELPDPKYKHLVASGLMGIFTKIWANVWSPRMEYILNNAILALLDTPNTTLMGINRILVDKDFRQQIIANLKDPVVKAFWVHEYEEWRDQFRNEAIAPIQNKVGQFLSTDIIRNVVGQTKSTIDIFEIMNSGKILLINVSKGRIGEDNSALLGAMFITKIQLAAMERVRIPEEERVDFYLYVDEFQNFATDSFAGILSEARKYRLNLILAHQYVGQLVTDVSTKVRDAIFGNVGTMIMFRIGGADAEFLESEFSPEFTAEDMVNLPNYHIYLKMMVDGVSCRPFSARTLPPFRVKSSTTTAEDIIKNSRKLYARPRYIVEEEINRWSGMAAGTLGEAGGGQKEKEVVGAARGEGLPEQKKRPYMQRPLGGEKYSSELASLGIEFEERKEKKGVERRFKEPPEKIKRKVSVPAASPLQATAAAEPEKEEKPETISLKELKPIEKIARPKFPGPEINIEELRQAISESLSRAAEETEEKPEK
jgi:hypothetical protein